jgi:ketosteroid isomerase-like protein
VATWIDATARGDVDRVLELMDDEVVFLVPGRPPMRGKRDFAAATRAAAGMGRIDANMLAPAKQGV